MTPDSLESLSDQALSEVFAVEVAGWSDFGEHSRAWGCRTGFPPLGEGCMGPCPPFATSADAVLPHLEKWHVESANLLTQGWLTIVKANAASREYQRGIAPTFARAVCLALIKTHRAAKSAT